MSNEILYIGIRHFIVFINDDQSCFDLIRKKKKLHCNRNRHIGILFHFMITKSFDLMLLKVFKIAKPMSSLTCWRILYSPNRP